MNVDTVWDNADETAAMVGSDMPHGKRRASADRTRARARCRGVLERANRTCSCCADARSRTHGAESGERAAGRWTVDDARQELRQHAFLVAERAQRGERTQTAAPVHILSRGEQGPGGRTDRGR